MPVRPSICATSAKTDVARYPQRNHPYVKRTGSFFLVVFIYLYTGYSIAIAESSALQVMLIPEQHLVELNNNKKQYRYVPAGTVMQGGEIYYTVRIVNITNEKVRHATVVQAVPTNTHLVEDSTTGAGAAISYSMDGGKNFLSAVELRNVMDDSSKQVRITHIRWQFRHPLAPHVVVLARFSVVFD